MGYRWHLDGDRALWGIKQSGLGREGGPEGIEEYLEAKAFHWSGLG